jgi:ATPase family associated with various cellular activities (AAA)
MPETQSALLEAMPGRQVMVDGVMRPLPRPFPLLATESPIEQAHATIWASDLRNVCGSASPAASTLPTTTSPSGELWRRRSTPPLSTLRHHGRRLSWSWSPWVLLDRTNAHAKRKVEPMLWHPQAPRREGAPRRQRERFSSKAAGSRAPGRGLTPVTPARDLGADVPMRAASSPGSRTRLDAAPGARQPWRAASFSQACPEALRRSPNASFPTVDEPVFTATVDGAVEIEPSPPKGFAERATSFAASSKRPVAGIR